MAYEDDIEVLESPVKTQDEIAAELKFAVKPTHFVPKADEDEDEDYNESYRFENEEQVEEAELVGEVDSYVRDLERSFNPVTDKDSAEEYVEHDHEFAIDPYGNEHLKPSKGKKYNKFFGLFKIFNMSAQNPLKTALQNKLLANVLAEKVSTYRFHSIRDPKNQAGIFDNKKVKDRQIMLEEKEDSAHHVEDLMKSRDKHIKEHERF